MENNKGRYFFIIENGIQKKVKLANPETTDLGSTRKSDNEVVIAEMAQKLATTYADSPATTDLGRVFRFIARFIPVDMVLKVLSHKLK